MDFQQDIKQIKKEYYDILKSYYKTNTLILKMIALHTLSDLSEADEWLRTCELWLNSDKRINKLLDKEPKEAIHQLRTRALCCVYAIKGIEQLMKVNFSSTEQYEMLFEGLKGVNEKLYTLAKDSINQSNYWAKEHNMSLMFEDGTIKIEDFKPENNERYLKFRQ